MRPIPFARATAAVVFLTLAALSFSSPGLAANPASLKSQDPPAGPGAMAPNLTVAGRDLLLTWLEPVDPKDKDKGHRLRIARLAGGRWSAPVTIAAGTDFFANWADFPGVAVGPKGGLAAHWLAKNGPGTYDYAIQLARSADGGATWKRAGVLHHDGTPAEHGFVAWVAEPTGLRAFWLDGREMAKGGHDSHDGHGGHGAGAMTLRTAGIDSSSPEEAVDARVCECCQTDSAWTADGPIVVYRDRSDQEVRDIYRVRRTATGWSRPAPVHADNWKIPGCPVNGPAVAADGKSVAVAWFTGAENRPRVKVAFSQDAGERFGAPVEIDAGRPLGRVDVVLDGQSGAVVSWLASEGDGAAVHLRRVKGGKAGPVLSAATTGAGRSSGFPRMVRMGETLYVAWVEDGAVSKVRVASLPVAAVPGG